MYNKKKLTQPRSVSEIAQSSNISLPTALVIAVSPRGSKMVTPEMSSETEEFTDYKLLWTFQGKDTVRDGLVEGETYR